MAYGEVEPGVLRGGNRRNTREYPFNNPSIIRINKICRGNEHDSEEGLCVAKGGFSHGAESVLTAGQLR